METINLPMLMQAASTLAGICNAERVSAPTKDKAENCLRKLLAILDNDLTEASAQSNGIIT